MNYFFGTNHSTPKNPRKIATFQHHEKINKHKTRFFILFTNDVKHKTNYYFDFFPTFTSLQFGKIRCNFHSLIYIFKPVPRYAS